MKYKIFNFKTFVMNNIDEFPIEKFARMKQRHSRYSKFKIFFSSRYSIFKKRNNLNVLFWLRKIIYNANRKNKKIYGEYNKSLKPFYIEHSERLNHLILELFLHQQFLPLVRFLCQPLNLFKVKTTISSVFSYLDQSKITSQIIFMLWLLLLVARIPSSFFKQPWKYPEC